MTNWGQWRDLVDAYQERDRAWRDLIHAYRELGRAIRYHGMREYLRFLWRRWRG